jgi:hypothetical protein
MVPVRNAAGGPREAGGSERVALSPGPPPSRETGGEKQNR